MLVAATGRSSGTPPGGTVYTISPSGGTTAVGSYPGPGGADEIMIAPPGFGSAAGEALLTVDDGLNGGSVVAVTRSGAVRTIANLPSGPNPIAAITRAPARSSQPPPGLYVTDTNTQNVFFVAAAQLAPYVGDVIVGTELGGQLWVIRPRGNGFQTRLLPNDLPTTGLNLEAAAWIP
jgi:hypothetical protein